MNTRPRAVTPSTEYSCLNPKSEYFTNDILITETSKYPCKRSPCVLFETRLPEQGEFWGELRFHAHLKAAALNFSSGASGDAFRLTAVVKTGYLSSRTRPASPKPVFPFSSDLSIIPTCTTVNLLDVAFTPFSVTSRDLSVRSAASERLKPV